MYIPRTFQVDDVPTLHRFMKRYGFATLISHSAQDPYATHLPLVLDEDGDEYGILRGHFSRANPHLQIGASDADSLAIFHGPHSYVSPNDYSGDSPAVPTWNYATVHAYGRLRLIEDPAGLIDHLKSLVAVYEDGSAQPWAFEPASKFNAGLMNGIVGFEISIQRLEGKFKLGQNRPAEDQASMLDALQNGDHDARSLAAFIMEWTSDTDAN